MGRKKAIEDDALLDGLVTAFQSFGYEGASMNRLAEATGLGRASLYHRFPGGKEEMALAALGRADDIFGGYVLAPLLEAGDPADRVRRTAQRMTKFYDLGRKSCLLDTLSMGDEEALRESIKNSLSTLNRVLADVAEESGASRSEAKERANKAIVELQGALVWARGSGDTKPFKEAMRHLPENLVGANT